MKNNAMELYKRTDCEVSLSVLRRRLSKGESYSTARKLRNFTVFDKKYKNLADFAKSVSNVLTYQQLRYRVCNLKLTPEDALCKVFEWVESRKGTPEKEGKCSKVSRRETLRLSEVLDRCDL